MYTRKKWCCTHVVVCVSSGVSVTDRPTDRPTVIYFVESGCVKQWANEHLHPLHPLPTKCGKVCSMISFSCRRFQSVLSCSNCKMSLRQMSSAALDDLTTGVQWRWGAIGGLPPLKYFINLVDSRAHSLACAFDMFSFSSVNCCWIGNSLYIFLHASTHKVFVNAEFLCVRSSSDVSRSSAVQ